MSELDHEPKGVRFSEILHQVRERAAQGPVTLQELIEVFGPKGHVFLTLFLVLPFLQPIPMPGLSTALGLTIAWAGFLLMRGRPPWVPHRFGNVVVESKLLLKICGGLESVMRRLEHLIRPRGRSLFAQAWFRRLNGLLLAVHAAILSLPLPIPFSNFLPASVLFLIALASLEEDVVVIGIAYVAALANLLFFAALVIAPALIANGKMP